MRAFFLAAGFVAAASTAGAATLTDRYSSFFVFGDSLSDTGNLFSATPTAAFPFKVPPSPPYFEGRFSNGPVWAEPTIAGFATVGRAAASFAFGFAHATVDTPSVDLSEQIAMFQALIPSAALGPRPLAAIWIGANDVFSATDAGLSSPAVAAVGAQAAEQAGAAALAIAGLGFSDVALFNLPDLGRTPAYAFEKLNGTELADEATTGSAAFNTAIAAQADVLRAAGLRVTEIDVAGLFDALLDEPTAFGLDDPVNPCIEGDVLSVVLEAVAPCASVDGLAFWDSVHPTAAAHAQVGQAFRDALTPVPLAPAFPMLATALATIAALRRRKG
jgi:outer membrane lipase/esterase